MPITKNNFTHVTDTELEGVETSSFTVDFIRSRGYKSCDFTVHQHPFRRTVGG